MNPLCDSNYVETDLDSVDDQPIDFSKRYDDQLADDVCGSSSGKKRRMSSPSAVPNKMPGDELKVYCIEGTPLIVSSASSLCDLNEFGALIQVAETELLKQKTEYKTGLQELYSGLSGDTSHSTKSNEILQTEEFEQDQVENKDDSVEVGNTSRTDGNFSKTSSPLMFSRSSSISSLNSFEQHSIVDDRSSVSMFSNLASGIISPSEIPDSPGEAMSPFIPKQQSQFVFPPSDNHKSMEPVLAKLKLTSDPPFIDEAALLYVPEDNLKVFNDEGDCCSESNLSDLSMQTSSLSHVSVAVFHKNTFPDVTHKSSIRISCSIVTGSAELQSIDEDVDRSKKHAMNVMQPKENCVESSKSGAKDLSNYSVDNVVDDECQDEKINYSNLNPEDDECKDEDDSPAEDFNDDYEPCLNSFKNHIKEQTFRPENESPDYSKDISDDECNDLLAECIKKGMQETTSLNPNPPLSTSCQSPQESNPKEEEQNISDCDTSDSEEENELLQSCILLGMPQKLSSPLNKEPIQSNHQKPSNSPPKSLQNFSKEMDEVSDEDEYDPLLLQIIRLGEPKNEPKESYKKKLKVADSYPSDGQKLGYRDNRPDGVSDDEDEDDDILTECIQAGMPKPKPGTDHYQKQYSSPIKTLTEKPQPYPQRTLSASQDRENYMSSFAGPHLKCVKSPTREDRTMHQTYKIYQLQQHTTYPIDEDRIILPPAHTRSHQRQSHRRSPATEDKAMLLNSIPGQWQPQPHRRSPTTFEQTRLLAYCEEMYQSQTCRKSPTTETRSILPASSTGLCQPHRSSANVDRIAPSNADQRRKSPSTLERTRFQPPTNAASRTSLGSESRAVHVRKYFNWIPNSLFFRNTNVSPAMIPDDVTCTYRTEDTPILSPSASMSDLSTLSFSEDKMFLDGSLNNSLRNSDCSSESEEDELLLQCIRSGMPTEKRAHA